MRQRTLVIGGGGALGRSILAAAARRGDRTALIGLSPERVAEAKRVHEVDHDEVHAVAADVRDRVRLDEAIQSSVAWLGGLDHLVFAAGRLRALGPAVDAPPDEWEADLETSLIGFMNAVRSAIGFLKKSEAASITVLVGHGHHVGVTFASAHAAAQAGLVRLAEGLSAELKADAIPVFAVFPGIVPSRFTQHLIDTEEGRKHLPWVNEAFAEGKEVAPEFTADMVEWLTRTRPTALSGRVVFAPLSPELLELRLNRIEAEDLNRLRLK